MENYYEKDAPLYPHYQVMRNSNPVFLNPNGRVWEIYTYKECLEVFTRPDLFSSEVYTALGYPELQTVAMMDPPRHTMLRKLISKAFSLKLVNQQADQIQNMTDRLIDKVISTGEMDIVNDVAFPLPVSVIAEMLGIPVNDHDLFKKWAAACLVVIEKAMGRIKPEQHLLDMVKQMTDYLSAIAIERRASPRADLISALASAIVDDECLTIDEIANTCKVLVNAGHDTTKLLIGNAMNMFLQNPKLVDQVMADSQVFDMAIDEILRYTSPSQFMARVVTTDTELAGQQLKKGDWVKLFLGSANRDPSFFSEPDVFDINRNPNRHLAFGYGIHYCLGAPLGRLEARICLQTMLRRLKNIRFNPDKPKTRLSAPVQFGWQVLPVLFEPAAPIYKD
ncbi:cytochrome P450 [Massilia sp. W12]|uniref:cytochrome P450 n=1 Tax=Massilia sp. W12 TaxID=3126507 RepID=UPI0030CB0C53